MKLNEILNKRTSAFLLLIIGVLLAISPAGTRVAYDLSPNEIAAVIASESDHVSAEDVAAWIIDKRVDLFIADIRTADEYNKYHIPGAVNIPFTRLFEQESIDMMDSDYLVVLYSNGGTHAAQAWVILQQMGIESYVLLGGLNYWIDSILNPIPPDDLVADSEILQFEFQKAASGYFNSGGMTVDQSQVDETQTKPIIPKRKFGKRKKADEGC